VPWPSSLGKIRKCLIFNEGGHFFLMFSLNLSKMSCLEGFSFFAGVSGRKRLENWFLWDEFSIEFEIFYKLIFRPRFFAPSSAVLSASTTSMTFFFFLVRLG
jgi:hypothetical protein